MRRSTVISTMRWRLSVTGCVRCAGGKRVNDVLAVRTMALLKEVTDLAWNEAKENT